MNEPDPLYPQALDFAKAEPTMTVSKMQRRLQLGYNRAARLCEQIEINGHLARDNRQGGWKRANQGSTNG